MKNQQETRERPHISAEKSSQGQERSGVPLVEHSPLPALPPLERGTSRLPMSSKLQDVVTPPSQLSPHTAIAFSPREPKADDKGTLSSNVATSESLSRVPSSSRPHGKSFSEDSTSATWKTHSKHVFVLSSAGRPIYSRYGDELQLASLTAVLTGLISFVGSLEGDTLRTIRAGRRVFVFSLFGPLYLVAVSHNGESVTQLRIQLQYLHAQIIALLTQNVHSLLWKRPQFDVRNLLGGTDNFLDRLLRNVSRLPDIVLNSVHCLRLNQMVRDALGTLILNECPPDMSPQNPSPLFYALLLANDRIVQLVRPKHHILAPCDLHLIINFLTSDTMVKQITTANQVWSPLCLPWFNTTGYMHLYATYLTVDNSSDDVSLRITLVLLAHRGDTLDQLSRIRDRIVSQLQAPANLPIWHALVEACRHPTYSVDEVQIPELLHFVYTSRSYKQLTMPSFQGTPYYHPTQRRRLMRLYQHVHHRVHLLEAEGEGSGTSTSGSAASLLWPTPPHPTSSPFTNLSTHKVYYYISQRETVVAWTSKNSFELYAVFGPLVSKPVAIQGCNSILRWINTEEVNLFILRSSVW